MTNTVYQHLYVESKKIKQMNVCNKTERFTDNKEQTSGYQSGEERKEE